MLPWLEESGTSDLLGTIRVILTLFPVSGFVSGRHFRYLSIRGGLLRIPGPRHFSFGNQCLHSFVLGAISLSIEMAMLFPFAPVFSSRFLFETLLCLGVILFPLAYAGYVHSHTLQLVCRICPFCAHVLISFSPPCWTVSFALVCATVYCRGVGFWGSRFARA